MRFEAEMSHDNCRLTVSLIDEYGRPLGSYTTVRTDHPIEGYKWAAAVADLTHTLMVSIIDGELPAPGELLDTGVDIGCVYVGKRT